MGESIVFCDHQIGWLVLDSELLRAINNGGIMLDTHAITFSGLICFGERANFRLLFKSIVEYQILSFLLTVWIRRTFFPFFFFFTQNYYFFVYHVLCASVHKKISPPCSPKGRQVRFSVIGLLKKEYLHCCLILSIYGHKQILESDKVI